MEVPLLGQTSPAQAEDQAPAFVEAETAFLVYVMPDGSVVMNPNIDTPITIERPPTQHDVWVAVMTVKKDIEQMQAAIQAAQLTLSNLPMALTQFQQQMQGALQNAQIQAKLAEGR